MARPDPDPTWTRPDPTRPRPDPEIKPTRPVDTSWEFMVVLPCQQPTSENYDAQIYKILFH